MNDDYMKGFFDVSKQMIDISQNMLNSYSTDQKSPGKEFDKTAKDMHGAQGERLKGLHESVTKSVFDMIDNGHFPDQKAKKHVRLQMKELLNAFSPANSVFTNPELLKLTLDENGQNLERGRLLLMEDLKKSVFGALNVSQTDHSQFKLGDNIAISSGSVIYRNELIELIQYTPKKKMVYKTPMLIVPPFINKYYILDLNKERSVINFLLDKGMQVFCISWKNPDHQYRNYSFDDYISRGIFSAMTAIKLITGQSTIHPVGYCVGGTLLAMALALLKTMSIGVDIIASTFFATLIDFTDPGELQLFVSEDQLRQTEVANSKKGYFDGRYMMNTFSLLQSENLIWPNIIENYMKGTRPKAFDTLYWNQDTTNLTEKIYSDYLRYFYIRNSLSKKQFRLFGQLVDLGNISMDIFCLGCKKDHIVPWKSALATSSQLPNASVDFVLSDGGHVMGVIQGLKKNPKKKRVFLTNGDNHHSDNPELWLENANVHEGSWWPHWAAWLSKRLGAKTSVSKLKKSFKPLCDAPGDYVCHRIDENESKAPFSMDDMSNCDTVSPFDKLCDVNSSDF